MATMEIAKIKGERIGEFDCGNMSINTLVEKSYYPTILQHAYGYDVCYNGKVIGVYMLKFVKILLDTCPDEISEFQSDLCKDCFSVHITYIAVGKEYQKKGLGTIILKYIIKSVMDLCEKWPIRLITLDALKEKYDWYKSLGFCPLNERDMDNDEATIKMYMDCLLDAELVNTYYESLV